MSFPKNLNFILLGIVLMLTACGPKKVVSHGPMHDADWPIEDPNAPAYSDFVKGKHFSEEGKVDAAIAAFEAALKHNTSTAMIYQALAFEWSRKGDLEKAEKFGQKAVEIDPLSRDNYFLLGKIDAARQNWAASEKDLKKAIELDPDKEEESTVALSSVYMESKQSDKAVQLLETYTKKNPQSLFGFYYLGRVYSDLGRIDDGLKAYGKALAINPGFLAALKATALIFEYQGKKEDAIKAFEQVLDSEPGNTTVRIHLSQLYLEKKDMEGARKQLELIIDEQPENMIARLRLGLIYLQENKLAESEKVFRKLVKDSPQKSQAHYYLGVVLERKEDHKGALENFLAVDAGTDNYLEARLATAYIYEQNKNFKASEKLLKELLQKNPDEPEVLVALTGCLNKQNRSLEARSMLDAALSRKPKEEMLWFALGETYEKMGNLPMLESSMRKVLEINPEQANALNYLGYSFAEKGIKLDEAEKLILKALEIRPKDGFITDSLGWVYYQKKQYDKSLKTLKEANEYTSNEPTILEHLGDVYLQLKQKEKAKESYEQAYKNSKEDVEKERIREKLKKLGKKF